MCAPIPRSPYRGSPHRGPLRLNPTKRWVYLSRLLYMGP
jgi:hypothetical protein